MSPATKKDIALTKAHMVLRVNGEEHDLVIPVEKTLLEVLREDLRLTRLQSL